MVVDLRGKGNLSSIATRTMVHLDRVLGLGVGMVHSIRITRVHHPRKVLPMGSEVGRLRGLGVMGGTWVICNLQGVRAGSTGALVGILGRLDMVLGRQDLMVDLCIWEAVAEGT